MSANALASPTFRNTYSNAYDLPHRPSPASASPANTLTKTVYHPPKRLVSPYPKKDDEPYVLPLGLKSILKNTTHKRSIHTRCGSTSLRRSSIPCLATTNSASPRERKRIFFPSTKKVSYRQPLIEEIKTVRYTWRHSDLPSDSDELPSEPESTDNQSGSSDSDSGSRSLASPPKRKRQDSTRDTTTERPIRSPIPPKSVPESEHKDAESTTSSRTPHSRKRRRREWKWTLGPISLPEPFPAPTSNPANESPDENAQPTDNSASSSALSTPPSSLASSFSSASGRPKLGINTSFAQPASSNSSYTTSPEYLAEGDQDGMTKKLMPEQKTPFPFSRESSVESDETSEASNPVADTGGGAAGSALGRDTS
ncbi:MAG: hypothetical protein Q9227_002552 [Pyrenula ochraceoflavens]